MTSDIVRPSNIQENNIEVVFPDFDDLQSSFQNESKMHSKQASSEISI